jgi:NAD(P)-dependent dehydrogenase (short-subunit alcohol dehydrogenase family)
MTYNPMSYEGKTALVVGGASGMGAATADLVRRLGGDVIVADVIPSPVSDLRSLHIDLRSPKSVAGSIAKLDGTIDTLFSCAGITDPTPGVMQVNFLGQRLLVEVLMDEGIMSSSGTIGMISSTGGLGWESELSWLSALLDTESFEDGDAWVEANPDRVGYVSSKQAVCAYVAQQGLPFLRRGVRINAILPGPTDTPLARANPDTWLIAGEDYRKAAGIALSKPEEQAMVLTFLCSEAASYIAGTNVITDCGRTSARLIYGQNLPE